MYTILALLVLALTPIRDDHGSAVAALADVQNAVGEIVRIEDGNDVGRAAFARAANHARSALDAALAHLDTMLDQRATPRWQPAIEGAKVNLLAAEENLTDAAGEHELDDYEYDVTRALANIALAVGRPAQDGALGGLTGALANTDLAVPAGARRVNGCSAPAQTPAYGVSDGQLIYVALPRSGDAAPIPPNLDIRSIAIRGNDVMLYTAHTAACKVQRTREVAAATVVPALYTAAQAHAGIAIYVHHCLQCHGADLQGTAGPAVAGTEFLKTAKFDGWSLEDMRTTVFTNMPFSDPGSLTPTQYADVMAFLLASSCFPAGSKPFPRADQPSFASLKLAPPGGIVPTNRKTGTCAVK